MDLERFDALVDRSDGDAPPLDGDHQPSTPHRRAKVKGRQITPPPGMEDCGSPYGRRHGLDVEPASRGRDQRVPDRARRFEAHEVTHGDGDRRRPPRHAPDRAPVSGRPSSGGAGPLLFDGKRSPLVAIRRVAPAPNCSVRGERSVCTFVDGGPDVVRDGSVVLKVSFNRDISFLRSGESVIMLLGHPARVLADRHG